MGGALPRPGVSRGIWRAATVLVVVFLGGGGLVGCATPAGRVFPAVEPALEWPGPPHPARIRYVGEISSAADLKPRRSGWQNFIEGIAGRKPSPRMESPLDVTLADGERLYVADPAAGCIHMFDLVRREYKRLGEEAGISSPISVAWGANGLFVVDGDRQDILHIDADGVLVARIGQGQLTRPTGVCVVPLDASIVVADAGSHQIVRFSAAGELLGRIGSRGWAAGQFNFPIAVECDEEGRLYVCDSLNFRVQILTLEGAVLGTIGSLGNRPGDLSLPKGVALDSDGQIYLVDAHFENVQIFDREGRILLPFGNEGGGPGEFWLPAGIHIDSGDRIWVADSYNHRVQLFEYLPAPEVESGLGEIPLEGVPPSQGR